MAVVVDQPGCSYNPDGEQHQDAVAEAVAAEVKKTLASGLMPKPPPQFAEAGASPSGQITELAMLQVRFTTTPYVPRGLISI